MKVKTSNLIGPALDWAVAKCEGYTEYDPETDKILPPRKGYGWVFMLDVNYSTDWEWCGPIIQREGIALWLSSTPEKGLWAAADDRRMSLDPESDEFLAMPDPWHGPTPLISAMRCYVASKLGDEIEVPNELFKG